jgi:hypothetical protein
VLLISELVTKGEYVWKDTQCRESVIPSSSS